MLSNLLVSGLALATVVNAAPGSSLPGHRKGFMTVPQVRAAGYVRHGPSAMAKTLLKFGKTVPDELAATIKSYKAQRRDLLLSKRANTTGSAVTTPQQSDVEYLTPVQIGTPAQTLNLDFDTGSSDLWVFSSETPSSSVSGQTTYNITKSSTATKLSGSTWSISYGDGSSSSGNVYTDVVAVGGVSFDKMAVESATKVSSSFTEDANNDGLLGLAFSTLNTVTPTAQKTFFDNIKSSLGSALFTADLKHNEPGTYNFGFVDDSLYTGTLSYTDVDTSDGFWAFTADSFAVGGSNSTSTTTTDSTTGSSSSRRKGSKSNSANSGSSLFSRIRRQFGGGNGSGHGSGGGSGSGSGSNTGTGSGSGTTTGNTNSGSTTSSSTITGIADTGTTLAMLPAAVCESYYSQVSGASYSSSAGGYIFSCDATLPDFSFTVGSTTVTIPGDYVNYSELDSTGQDCYGGIQPDTSIGFAIFGDVALKSAFVVFENSGSTPRLGFAAKTLVTSS